MIWYSHVNEDSSAERNFNQDIGMLFCIVGSGERLIALLDNHSLKQVYAVDTNLDAIQLLKLKLAALNVLHIHDYFGFIGAIKCTIDERMIFLDRCLQEMDNSSKLYWNEKREIVKKGILFIGQYEVFLTKIRPFLKVLLGKSFYKIFNHDYKRFPFIRWKIVQFFFSNKLTFKLFGNKDISFVGAHADVSLISKSFQALIDQKVMNNSFMAHLVFKGHLQDMPKDSLPASLDPNVLKRVQDRLRNREIHITFEHDTILKVFEKYHLKLKGQKIFCSMSDILSFEKPEYIIQCIKRLAFIETSSIAFVIRSFLRNHLEKIHIQKIRKLGFTVENISHLDRSNMYKVYIVKQHEKNKL